MKLLLFSGGVESTCLAYTLRPDLLLTVDYGQISALGEIRSSSYLAKKFGLAHAVLTINARDLGVGELAGQKPLDTLSPPETWPFRNQLLITVAAMRYVREGYDEIIIGTVSTDSAHADGTQKFISAMQAVLQSQFPMLRLTAPAIGHDTLALLKASGLSRDCLGWTFSCYRGPVACGQCSGCFKTLEIQEMFNA